LLAIGFSTVPITAQATSTMPSRFLDYVGLLRHRRINRDDGSCVVQELGNCRDSTLSGI